MKHKLSRLLGALSVVARYNRGMRINALVGLGLLSVICLGWWRLHTAAASPIVGLWSRTPTSTQPDDPVRFYFFHDSGIGLYRYGKIGMNNTNSFDWKVSGESLELRFRKTGEVKRSKFAVHNAQLVLQDDPKEPDEKDVAYTYVPATRDDNHYAILAPDLEGFGSDVNASTAPSARIGGRLWMHQQKFATGGNAFGLYQLKEQAIDGRGIGWHHIGDFDDWSTEALAFRTTNADAASVTFDFTLRHEHATSALRRNGDVLTLNTDPRNFWHIGAYHDAGPSFGALASAAH